MQEDTKNIDDCECIYCHHKFDGHNAINNNLDTVTVECSKCNREMGVLLSVEYVCHELED